MFGPTTLPIFVLTDSYKLAHASLYPDSNKLVAYGEFRSAFNKSTEDSRLIFFGIRYIIETYVNRQWTHKDIQDCERFFSTHNAGATPFPFPKELFEKFVNENEGYFPIKIQALPEGSVIYPHVPVYQITAKSPYAKLVTFLETLLTMVWYPSTVATLSRQCRDIIESAFKKTVDDSAFSLIPSRFHDFGFRGCTSVEQGVIGGAAHLINFNGSDTLAAGYYAQYHWNDGRPVAESIPATEHSVMTAHNTEREAIAKLLEVYGDGFCACVMDSYDYVGALANLLPEVASKKIDKGGFLVIRPDSGDPIENVLLALRSCEKVFGCSTNEKGFKVLNGCGVIQGDGINKESLEKILAAVIEAGYSAQNVSFGIGGALLQKVHRDTMSFATKLSFRLDDKGNPHDIAKCPKTDLKKTSLPGEFRVLLDPESNLPTVHPKAPEDETEIDGDLLRTVYDMGRPLPSPVFDDFDTIRNRAKSQWEAYPPHHDPLTPALKARIQKLKNDSKEKYGHQA